MKKYKIGVIGAGARGETFARQLYRGMERAQLFGVCDIDPDRLGKFVDYCGLTHARTFTSVADFLSQKELDAVVIATPEFTHEEVAIAALAQGKHIYLEKPIASTSETGRNIIYAHRRSGAVAYLGFNLRANRIYERAKAIVESGILGQIVHIEAMEQLSQAHSASFMRRFHRKVSQSGGMLNHKCSHDLDIMLWLIGHERKVVKVASFGGVNVFLPKKQPAKYCRECQREIRESCRYRDQAGFVFPVGGAAPIHKTNQLEVYGGDLCVYNSDKDILDNQTLIMEWDHGVRGNFTLHLFQARGERDLRIWGEKANLRLSDDKNYAIRVVVSDTGDVIEHKLPPPRGGGLAADGGDGHGGADARMLGRFMDAIEGKGAQLNSGLTEGLAATIVAEAGLKSQQTGKVIEIKPEEYL